MANNKYESDTTRDNEQRKFQADINEETAVNVKSANIEQTIDKSAILGLTKSSGLQDGEAYDSIIAGAVDAEQNIVQYELNGICQFQIEVNFVDGDNFSIVKRVCEFDMLQEDGFVILQENGDALRVQGLVK